MKQELRHTIDQLAGHALHQLNTTGADQAFYMACVLDIVTVVATEATLEAIEVRWVQHSTYWRTAPIKWAFWSNERKIRLLAYEHAFQALDAVRRRNGQ